MPGTTTEAVQLYRFFYLSICNTQPRTCHGSSNHSGRPDSPALLLGRLIGSLAEYIRSLLPPPPARRRLLLMLLLLLVLSSPRHLLLLAVWSAAEKSPVFEDAAAASARESREVATPKGFSLLLLLEVDALLLLLLPLVVDWLLSASQPSSSCCSSSRVRIIHDGSLLVEVLSERDAVSLSSRTALLTSSCLRCFCCCCFGGKGGAAAVGAPQSGCCWACDACWAALLLWLWSCWQGGSGEPFELLVAGLLLRMRLGVCTRAGCGAARRSTC